MMIVKYSLGRVLTLVNSNDRSNRVYGVAYKIDASQVDKIFGTLNLREKCGYSMEPIMFYPHDEEKSYKCVAYFANQENFYYSPEHDLKNLALQIARSSGPSPRRNRFTTWSGVTNPAP